MLTYLWQFYNNFTFIIFIFSQYQDFRILIKCFDACKNLTCLEIYFMFVISIILLLLQKVIFSLTFSVPHFFVGKKLSASISMSNLKLIQNVFDSSEFMAFHIENCIYCWRCLCLYTSYKYVIIAINSGFLSEIFYGSFHIYVHIHT